eukprot:351628-Chlamydomonas_euryale.AAC.3
MSEAAIVANQGLCAPCPLLDPLCHAALNTCIPFVGALPVTLTLYSELVQVARQRPGWRKQWRSACRRPTDEDATVERQTVKSARSFQCTTTLAQAEPLTCGAARYAAGHPGGPRPPRGRCERILRGYTPTWAHA